MFPKEAYKRPDTQKIIAKRRKGWVILPDTTVSGETGHQDLPPVGETIRISQGHGKPDRIVTIKP